MTKTINTVRKILKNVRSLAGVATIAVILSVVFSGIILPKEADADTINAASCSQADVTTAITSASAGDTVSVPAGSCTWDSLTISKAIHLKGAGTGSTNIELVDNTINKQAGGVIRISDFTFTKTGGGNESKGWHVGGNWQTTEPAIFEDNEFTVSGSGMFMLNTTGGVIIANNDITLGWDDSFAQVKDQSVHTSWTTDSTMGADDTNGKYNIYFETNTFYGGASQAIDCDENSRCVYRYNTAMYSSFNSHGYDTSPVSTRHWEIYNNDFNFDYTEEQIGNINWLAWIRGGTGVIFNNEFANIAGSYWGNKDEIHFSIRGAEDVLIAGSCEATSYPVEQQIGQGYESGSYVTDPIYIWGNTGTQSIGAGWRWGNPCGFVFEDFFEEGRDYFVDDGAKPGYTPYTYPHPLVGLDEEPGETYTVGGTITGITGEIMLQLNETENIATTSNTSFTFTTPLEEGDPYSIEIAVEPPGQTCDITNGSGTMGTANVTNVTVTCEAQSESSGVEPDGESVLVDNDGLPAGNITFSKTTAGSDRAIVVAISVFRPWVDSPVTVTYDGEAVTPVTYYDHWVSGETQGHQYVGLFVIPNPNLSATNVVVNLGMPGWGADAGGVITVASYKNVDQEDPVRSFDSVSSRTLTLASASEDMLVSSINAVSGVGAISSISSNHEKLAENFDTADWRAFGVAQAEGDESVDMIWTMDQPLSGVRQVALSLRGISEEEPPADETAPTVTAFVIPATHSSLTVPINTFTATDDTGVTGYMVTESSSAPSSEDGGWSGTAQTQYVFATEGSKTLYAWAKDEAGNVSTSQTDSVTITLPTYTVGGTISGLDGTVVLQNNNGDDLSRSANGAFAFSTELEEDDAYDVTVLTQPENQTCIVSDGAGSVATENITNITVTCEDNPDETAPTVTAFVIPATHSSLTVPINTFTATDDTGVTGYMVTESSSAPSSEDGGWSGTAQTQYVFATEGSKTLYAWAKDEAGNVSTSQTDSVTITLPTYTVGGTISGLDGTVVLQNNNGDDLSRSANGAFAFSTELEEDDAYDVTVLTQPDTQTCIVSNGSGTVGTEHITNITVTCTDDEIPPGDDDDEPETYTIGGSISGLTGTVTLQNNGGNNLSRSANGVFTFSTELEEDDAYSVTVLTQPDNQTCIVSNGSGTVSTSNITNITVTCTDDEVPPGDDDDDDPPPGDDDDDTPPDDDDDTPEEEITQDNQSNNESSGRRRSARRRSVPGIITHKITETIKDTATTIKYLFTRNLGFGMIGDDVQKLQQFLNNNGYTLTNTNEGSPGNETTFFGTLTRSALARFQSANNITPPEGFFGPITREFINRMEE